MFLEEITKLEAENESLRKWKQEATEVLAKWDEVWIAAGRPGLGKHKSDGVIGIINVLRQQIAKDSSCGG